MGALELFDESKSAQNRSHHPDLRGAHVAQSVEHLHGKEKVIGSIPIVGSIWASFIWAS